MTWFDILLKSLVDLDRFELEYRVYRSLMPSSSVRVNLVDPVTSPGTAHLCR